MILRLLTALVPTILIELGVLCLLKERRLKVLLASVAINVLTNPLLNLYLNCIDGGWTSIGVGEVVVVVVEAACYYLLLRRIDTAIIYSLLCNAISFLTGCLVLLLAALV